MGAATARQIGATTPPGASGRQLSFLHLREPDAPGIAGPGARAFARAEATRVIDAGASPESVVRYEALERVRAELLRYINLLGVVAEFQSVDFLNDLDRRGLRPHPDALDMRATGGLFRQLIADGVIEPIGYRPNAGAIASNYSSTARPVYRVAKRPISEGSA